MSHIKNFLLKVYYLQFHNIKMTNVRRSLSSFSLQKAVRVIGLTKKKKKEDIVFKSQIEPLILA